MHLAQYEKPFLYKTVLQFIILLNLVYFDYFIHHTIDWKTKQGDDIKLKTIEKYFDKFKMQEYTNNKLIKVNR